MSIETKCSLQNSNVGSALKCHIQAINTITDIADNIFLINDLEELNDNLDGIRNILNPSMDNITTKWPMLNIDLQNELTNMCNKLMNYYNNADTQLKQQNSQDIQSKKDLISNGRSKMLCFKQTEGGAFLKTTEKVLIGKATRCVYKSGRKKYIKQNGKFVSLTEAKKKATQKKT